jgi:hypothetical protein
MGSIRWIVLVQKTPKGPFTTEELQSLIEQGLVRRNDVAFQVLEGSQKAHTGWKFIWQFEEFERRNPDENSSPRPNEPEEERRTNPRREITLEELPPEIAAIQPDDLVLGRRDPFAQNETVEMNEQKIESSPKNRFGWVYAGVGLAGLVLVYWFQSGRQIANTLSPKPPTPSRPPASVQATRKLPEKIVEKPVEPEKDTKSVAPPAAKPDSDTKPDRGEIKRLDSRGDEDLRKNVTDEEYDRELADDEETDSLVKSKKKKKQKPPVADDEEEVTEEPVQAEEEE